MDALTHDTTRRTGNMQPDSSTCILCGERRGIIREYCRGGYNVVQCAGCSLCFVAPLPSREFLAGAYKQEYYAPWLREQRKRRERMWKKRLETLNSLSRRKGSLLDVGCGDGLFLELARNEGWHPAGTDISPFASAYGKGSLGLPIHQGELNEIGFADETFDAVTMWHVLEHTTDPIAVLKEARRVIKKDGVLIVAVPNLNNILSQWAYRIVKGRSMHLFDPEDRELHLYHFNTRTITMALEKAGFTVRGVGPDMGIVQHRIRILNHLARAAGIVSNTLITDALEINAAPSDGSKRREKV